MKIQARRRLLAFELGDETPPTWKQGDVDVTFTPFCQEVRRHLSSSVHGIRASKDQQWIVVYVDHIKAKDLTAVNKALKASRIPGNPRFNSCIIAEASGYAGLLALKFKIY